MYLKVNTENLILKTGQTSMCAKLERFFMPSCLLIYNAGEKYKMEGHLLAGLTFMPRE